MTANTNTSNDPRVVKLTNVRLSFPALFEPKAGPNDQGGVGKPKYAATFLLDKKTQADQISKIKAAMEYVIKEDGKGKRPGLNKFALRDGAEKPEVDGYGEGVMFISARTEKAPNVVDRDLSRIDPKSGRIYAGCFVNATIRLWYQDSQQYGKRVNAALRNVQFVRDGEPFGERQPAAEEEFEALSDEGNVDGV